MNATDCVVVRLLLLPDKIIIPAGQRLPSHALLDIENISAFRLFQYLPGKRGYREFSLLVKDDRQRYQRVLDELREKLTENLKGQLVTFTPVICGGGPPVGVLTAFGLVPEYQLELCPA